MAKEKIQVPDKFRCPITSLIMRDPVLASDGHHYEREAIEKWFIDPNHRAPVGGLHLANKTVIPDEPLKNQIEAYLKQNPELIINNEVYLPRKFFELFREIIEKHDKENDKEKLKSLIVELKNLIELDFRVLTLSSEKAVNLGVSIYVDQTKLSDKSGYHFICEVNTDNKNYLARSIGVKRIEIELLVLPYIEGYLDELLTNRPNNWHPNVLSCALTESARKNDLESCKKWLRLGADRETIDSYNDVEYYKDGRTPLHWAVCYGSFDVVKFLVARDLHLMSEIPEKLDLYKGSYILIEKSLKYVRLTGHFEDVKIHDINNFLNELSKINSTSASKLSLSNDQINSLITLNGGHIPDVKCNINAQSFYGWGTLHYSCYDRNTEMLKFLLEKGVNTELTTKEEENKDGWGRDTPLHIAVHRDNPEAVKLLLDHGANIEAKNKDGNTPLHIATTNENKPVISLLMERGANIRARRNNGHFAMGCPGIHTNDKWTVVSRYTEELFGQQVSNSVCKIRLLEKTVDEQKNEIQDLKKRLNHLEGLIQQMQVSPKELAQTIVSSQDQTNVLPPVYPSPLSNTLTGKATTTATTSTAAPTSTANVVDSKSPTPH